MHLVGVNEEMAEHIIVIFCVSSKAVYKELLALFMTCCFINSPIVVHFFKISFDFDLQLAVLLLHVEDCLRILHGFCKPVCGPQNKPCPWSSTFFSVVH